MTSFSFGPDAPLLLISGPCVIESPQLCREVAAHLMSLCSERNVRYVFKASFDKANRTSIASSRGPGLDGLDVLRSIKDEFGVAVTTDVHLPEQCEAVAQVCDVLQIPAFLCRQTDLLVAAAQAAQRYGGWVNVKKGQFLAPEDTRNIVEKVKAAGCERILLTERGTTFGYHNLVVDMRGLEIMRGFAPVCFDATHSVQKPGGSGTTSGGDRRFVPTLARAAMAVGVDALFVETHPDPDNAQSDGPNTVPLSEMAALLDTLLKVRDAVR